MPEIEALENPSFNTIAESSPRPGRDKESPRPELSGREEGMDVEISSTLEGEDDRMASHSEATWPGPDEYRFVVIEREVERLRGRVAPLEVEAERIRATVTKLGSDLGSGLSLQDQKVEELRRAVDLSEERNTQQHQHIHLVLADQGQAILQASSQWAQGAAESQATQQVVGELGNRVGALEQGLQPVGELANRLGALEGGLQQNLGEVDHRVGALERGLQLLAVNPLESQQINHRLGALELHAVTVPQLEAAIQLQDQVRNQEQSAIHQQLAALRQPREVDLASLRSQVQSLWAEMPSRDVLQRSIAEEVTPVSEARIADVVRKVLSGWVVPDSSQANGLATSLAEVQLMLHNCQTEVATLSRALVDLEGRVPGGPDPTVTQSLHSMELRLGKLATSQVSRDELERLQIPHSSDHSAWIDVQTRVVELEGKLRLVEGTIGGERQVRETHGQALADLELRVSQSHGLKERQTVLECQMKQLVEGQLTKDERERLWATCQILSDNLHTLRDQVTLHKRALDLSAPPLNHCTSGGKIPERPPAYRRRRPKRPARCPTRTLATPVEQATWRSEESWGVCRSSQ